MAIEPVPLPHACGYAVLQICVGQARGSNISHWMAVVPSTVTLMSNPPDSPSDCIKVFLGGGRGIYVRGTLDEVADKLRIAATERALDACDGDSDENPP